LKRADTLVPTMARLGLHTRHANTVDEATGRLDLNNRAHLQIMCQSLASLVKQRVSIESQQKADYAQVMLWHEQLAMLDTQYDFSSFIASAMDMPEEHKNFDVCSRALDLLFTINEIELKYEQPKLLATKKPVNKDMIKAAFMKKIESYKKIATTAPKINPDLKTAFLAKIQQQKEKLRKLEEQKEAGDAIDDGELPADSLRVPNQSLRM
jgi:hypothetical protein